MTTIPVWLQPRVFPRWSLIQLSNSSNKALNFSWQTGTSTLSQVNWALRAMLNLGPAKIINNNINNIIINRYNITHYYSFKIFPHFWLVETTRIIHHNQLLFTKFGKKLRHIESMTSKVQPAADYWTNDVKRAARCRLLNRWPKKTGDEIVLFLLAWKWLRVGLEVWATKTLPSYLTIKTVRIPKSWPNNIA